ncbi:MAG: bifunctional riboflavin kinase/FAD synthetase [Gammaproteobacteria bacterium]|nr:bifunctional riboflavin kinase/FAD synthetase [Gammaproteobacteria bacterium]
MQLVRGLQNLSKIDLPSVVTIGAFDGLHLGHQAIIDRVIQVAKTLKATPTVVLFEPQPSEFFAPSSAPARLSRFRDKVEVLARLGIQRVVCLRFNSALASMNPERFVESVIRDGLKTKHLIVGDDFRFGERRLGDYAMLNRCADVMGFKVEDTPTTLHDGERISSTRIRAALSRGDCDQAETLLGRPYRISGRVGFGKQLGRTIGVPTANVALNRRTTPLGGVYAVLATTQQGARFTAVANVGVKPTVGGETRPGLEVHIFDFKGDLYGQRLDVDFMLKIRDERAFASFDALKEQIFQDQEQAKQFFAEGV